MNDDLNFDAIVIGGGPAGSALAIQLSTAGKRVALIEKEVFPRFHIGESLLPASTPIFKKLGVLHKMQEEFITKPGGKWFVGNGEWRGDFSICDEQASFAEMPFAFMVERSKLDSILLDRAKECGTVIFQPAKALEINFEDNCISGIRLQDSNQNLIDLKTRQLFDCSGRSTLFGKHFNLVEKTELNRMAIYAHFEAETLDKDLEAGWFVGKMIDDGWIWAIPLEKGKVSIGLVTSQKLFSNAINKIEEYFLSEINKAQFLEKILKPNFDCKTEVNITSNMGYTCKKLKGDGWALVGDAAFFVDPCFSSGVHLALYSASLAASAFLENHENSDLTIPSEKFDSYEEGMKSHEMNVSYMVRHFYKVSRFKRLQKISGNFKESQQQIKFNTFIGGDFSLDKDFAKETYESLARFIND